MPIFAQHGHGKSDKILTALEEGSIQGVVFGARNETRDNMISCISDLRQKEDGLPLLFDPQFYVCTLNPPNDRYLTEYAYYESGRTATDFVRGAKLADYAAKTLDLEQELGCSQLISPTVLSQTFNDRWYQISLNLADASLERHSALKSPPPLLLSFAFSEAALSSSRDVDEFLDQVTSWDAKGVYLLIAREEAGYSQRFQEDRLARLLYVVHVLGKLNGFEVVVGYTDFCGILLRAAGAAAFATGWSQSLRQFHRRSFIRRRRGGQPARLRYASTALFNSILLSELQQIDDVDLLDVVLSDAPSDKVITSAVSPEASDWNQRTSALHHWESLQKLDSQISGDCAVDLENLSAALEGASALYGALKGEGVVFERNSEDQHIGEWSAAIGLFRRMSGI